MTSRQLDEEAIFHIARDLSDSAKRAIYLDQVCAADQALRERVDALLDVHEKEQDFLKSSPEPGPTVDQPPISEAPGHQIGRYKLLQKIGEGGFGVVFVAEQQRPVRRKVAVRVIKPGMDTRAVVARFEVERQALALMDSPNIARVLDGGTTDNGRPYFVMELVKGVPITEYCDKNELATHARLALFLTVCQAVQHAHQKGIIHRDVKPSNILVTLHDGKPVVKVIDFGVAKALNQRLTERTLFTAFGQMVGTPQYMSPEQAEMSGLDVDTRSDIYSLGVLLYELLTGTTPLEAERLRNAGFGEMQRMIREEEPIKPSTRLSGSDKRLTIVAKHRSATPERLHKLVRGDLDWIVMKALDKDRARRFETASSLAADVRHFLNDEPVAACPPSTAYRFRKFARRNRTSIVAAGIVTVVLLAGVTSSTWLAVLMHQQRNEAQALARQAQSLVIEKALLHAVSGELKALEDTLAAYESRNQPASRWLPTLRGAGLLHRGDNLGAIKILEPVVKASPDNVAAASLLALAHWHEGHWEEGTIRANRLRDLEPREEFHDFDLLFKGYAFFFLDYARSSEIFKETVDRHPTWGIARAYRASTLALHAENVGRVDLLNEALSEINLAQTLMKDNAWVLLVRLWINYKVAVLHERHGMSSASSLEARDVADDLAAQILQEYPEHIFGRWVVAHFYDDIGEEQKADEVWLTLMTDSSDIYAFASIGYYYAKHSSEDTIRKIERLNANDRMVLVAKAFVLTDIPERKEDAVDICESLLADARSNWMCFEAVQIYLLLGETDKAREVCSNWITGGAPGHAVSTQAVPGEERSLAIIANQGEMQLPAEEADLLTRFSQEYPLGLVALSIGDREKAKKHFQACVEMDVNSHVFWARAFLKQMEESREWPRCNPNVDPVR